ncbi:regulatory protein RecX [Congregibacter litoralis]|uniref:Regulatory protein RecX n=1 Tax=Congregibacter litoralis KT71 TaxID=314285 RepID=A4AAD2_9GAMM|nr:regulatory protein RecX [Congregibacter litoralis]EAQ97009.1 hypothetical protein KT71_12140 [Congregibacter litoralis KT71]
MSEFLLYDNVSDSSELANTKPHDIRLAAVNLLARREHSRKELEQKLKKRFDDHGVVSEQLDRLTEEGLQSDARYAESFVRQRYNRGHGPLRVRQEMRQRGVPDEDVQMAMESAGYDWSSSASIVLKKKYGNTPAGDAKEKARRSRFMQYRGFCIEHFIDKF